MSPPRTPYILRHSLGALVHDVARLRRKHLDHALRPLGLTRAQRWLLIQLSQFEEGVYIERARSPVDRRQKLVRLTDAGYDALKRSTRISEAFNAEVLGGVDPDRVAAAEEVLAAMRARLTAMDEVGTGDVSDCTEPRPANDEA
jgi:MarR family transcriptional regulator, transcriptional regulator for hemolysin